jgi:hypothetical protein
MQNYFRSLTRLSGTAGWVLLMIMAILVEVDHSITNYAISIDEYFCL